MSDEENEAAPLVQPRPAASSRFVWTKLMILLLIMKTVSKIEFWQMVNFNIDGYTIDNETNTCTAVPFKAREKENVALGAKFLLSSLGGILSDVYFGCITVLTYGGMIQFWVSVFFPLLIQTSIICQNHTWYYVLFGSLTPAIGFVEPLILYGLMQNVNGSQSRTMIMFSYYIATTLSQSLGSLPSHLRYQLRHWLPTQSFEFLSIPFTALFVLSLHLLSRDRAACEKLENRRFRFPTMRRLQRYYIIVTAFVPFASAFTLEKNVFLWKEMKYYTMDDNGFISATIVSFGYKLGTIVLPVCGIVLLLKDMFPNKLKISIRIRLGLLLMISSKLILFILSFFPTEMSQLGQSHPIAIQLIYFAFAFIDGTANALTAIAMYELVDCITERCAKATYVGIFYTTWGLGLLVSGIILMLLSKLNSEKSMLTPKEDKVQPQFYIRHSIVIFLLLLSYVHYAKVSLPLAENLTIIEQDEQEIEQELSTL